MSVKIVKCNNRSNISEQDLIVYSLIGLGFIYFFMVSIYAGFSFDDRNVFSITINNSDGILTPFKVWMHRPIGYKIYVYLLSLIPGIHHYYYLNNLIFVYILLVGHNVIRLIGAYLITKAFVPATRPYKQALVFFTIYACTASLVSWELSLNAEDAAINILMLSTGLLLMKNRVAVFSGSLLMATLPYFKGITAIYAVPVFALVFLYRREQFVRLILLCGTMFLCITLLLAFFTPELKELFEMPAYEGSLPFRQVLKDVFAKQEYWIIWNPAIAIMLALGYSLFISEYENKKKSYLILFVIVMCLSIPLIEIFIQGKAWGHNGVSGAVVAIAFVIVASRYYNSSIFMIISCVYIMVQATYFGVVFHGINGQFAHDLQNMVNNADKVIDMDEPVLNLTFTSPYVAALQVKRPSASRYAINVPFDRINWKEVDKEKIRQSSGYRYLYDFVKNYEGNFMVMTEMGTDDAATLELVNNKIRSGYSRYFYVDQSCTEWRCLKVFIKNEYSKPIPEEVKLYNFDR